MTNFFKEESFESAATIILRIPGLVLLHYWWESHLVNLLPDTFDYLHASGSFISFLVFVQGCLILMLPLERLVPLYMHYISAALIGGGEMFCRQYVQQQIIDTTEVSTNVSPSDSMLLSKHFAEVLVHVFIASLVAFLLDIEDSMKRGLLAIHSLPAIARMANVSPELLAYFVGFSSTVTVLLCLWHILQCVPIVIDYLGSVCGHLVQLVEVHNGLAIAAFFWTRLFVPLQLLFFWGCLYIMKLYSFYNLPEHSAIVREPWYIVALSAAAALSTTPFSLLASCVTVSYISYWALALIKIYLQGYDSFLSDNVNHNGWTESITMGVLALQTGLIEMKMPHKFAVMSFILFIVLSALVQSMFEEAEPIILATASQVNSISRHVKGVSLCLLLFFFPVYMIYMLCLVFEVDFWTLIVISTCLMTSVQVLGLLIVYSLFLYDTLRSEPWDSLDDIVYYARAVIRVLEFLDAVFFVGAGLYESIGGHWGWTNSTLLVVHCYYNVWQRLQAGWRSFLQRRKASGKVSALPKASVEQLKNYEDVCAICYAEMSSAVLMQCGHLFHGACLKKWLYVQDSCPMCHRPVTHKSDDEAVEEER